MNEISQEPAEAREEASPSGNKVESVSECALVLTSIQIRTLVCSCKEPHPERTLTGDVKPEGTLIPDSLTATGFRSLVVWRLAFPNEEQPLQLAGQYELTFTVSKPVQIATAEFYAEINSVILAYPYIRQLVDDLSVKSLGQNVRVPPLDVPKFVNEQVEKKITARQLAAAATTVATPAPGASSDDETAAGQ